MIYTNKYEFQTDDRDVYFAGIKIPSFINNKPLSITSLCKYNKSPFCVGKSSENPKDVYQRFTEKWGITPSNFIKKFHGEWRNVNIAPVEKHVVRYAISSTRKIDQHRLETIWERKEDIEQAVEDGNEHLIPFIIYWNMTIQEARNVVGKGMWKQLCKNSMSRNKSIAKFLSRAQNKEELQYLNQLPSTLLRRGRNRFTNPRIVYILTKHYKCKELLGTTNVEHDREVMRFARIVDDTIDMAKRLRKPFNHDWSKRKWLEKHEEFTRKILAAKYSSDAFPCLEDIPEELKCISHGSLKAVLLDNPLAMKQESNVMRHCVGSYTDRVAQGNCLVYHIEEDNMSTTYMPTTLGIVYSSIHNKWNVQQHYGACNSKECVTEEHVELSEKVCELLNEKWRMK